MEVDKTCKNILTEKTCDHCINEEEDFCIKFVESFPYEIPEFHKVLLLEQKIDGILIAITAYIKDNKVHIDAKDYRVGSKYYLHFNFPSCKITQKVVPAEFTCEFFQSIK